MMEDLPEHDLRAKFERGDYHSADERARAQRLLRNFDTQREFEAKCERASKSAALDAKRSAAIANVIALVALAVACKEQIYALILLF